MAHCSGLLVLPDLLAGAGFNVKALSQLDRDERAAIRSFDRAIGRFQILVSRARLFGGIQMRRLVVARVAVEEACSAANAATYRHTRWLVAIGRARAGLRWFA